MTSPYLPSDDLTFDDDDASVKAGRSTDASQDPRHVEPGPAIEFQELVVPDAPHLGPTIGEGPDDLPPYTDEIPE
jgi:hypothetical protein